MDLIYTDATREEVGVLPNPELDLAFGEDENDFALTLKLSHDRLEKNCTFYADGTEIGGIVDGMEVDTAEKTITYTGRSWHGILASKVVEPLKEGETSADGVTIETEGDSVLPPGYKRLTHITATGAQCIDTEFKPNQNTRVEICVRAANTSGVQFPFCARSTTGGGAPFFGVLFRNADLRNDFGTTNEFFTQKLTTTSQIVIDKNKNKCTIGSETVTNTQTNFQIDYPLYLMASNDGGGAAYAASGDLYFCRIYDNDTLIRDYIPCLNASDVAGMYDVVGKQFYGSETDTPFVAGDVMPSDSSLVGRELVISGDANACLRWLCKRIGLSDFFRVTEENADVEVSRYAFEQYIDAYTGICGMLGETNLRLSIVATYKDILLEAVRRYDYSIDQELESDSIDYRMAKQWNVPNHLICLGTGNGADRIIVHLYADENGNISETQTLTGVDEIVAVMDKNENSDVETETDSTEKTEEDLEEERKKEREDLIERGKEQLAEMRLLDEVEVDFDAGDDVYHIGDIVGAYESLTGESVSAAVTKKIVTIKNNKATISYKVG